MRVVCSKCQQPVAGADIDLAANRALCRPCGELFAIPGGSAIAPAQVSALANVDATHVPVDLKWTERIAPKYALFTLAPSRMLAVPILVFALVWDSFIITFYTAMAHGKGPTIAFLFPLIHVGVGIFVTWFGLTRMFNTSRLMLDSSQFDLKSGPIPARNAHIAIDLIDQFDAIETRGNRGTSWAVRVLTRDDRARKLALPVDQREHALFVAAKLNEALATLRTPVGYRA